MHKTPEEKREFRKLEPEESSVLCGGVQTKVSDTGYKRNFRGETFVNATPCIFLVRTALAALLTVFASAFAQGQGAATSPSDAQVRELQKRIETLQKPLDQLRVAPDAVPAPLPDARSAGAKLVSTYCVQCHATPAPTLHTAKEWASVTERMHIQMDSRWRSVNTPTEQEMDSIVAYMQKHARQ